MENLTAGELKAVIAPLFGLEPADLYEIIVMTKGLCPRCDGRDNVIVLDTFGPESTGNLPFASTLFSAASFSERCGVCLTKTSAGEIHGIDTEQVVNALCFLTEEPQENIDHSIILIRRLCPVCGNPSLINGIDNLPRDDDTFIHMLGSALETRHIEYRISRRLEGNEWED